VHFLPESVPDSALQGLRDLAPDALVLRAAGEVAIDHGGPISASALTLARLDRALGRGATARNWNTLGKIAEALARGPDHAIGAALRMA
jgi:uncharacterized protein (DUF1697 family)